MKDKVTFMVFLKKISNKLKKIYQIIYVLYLDIDRLKLSKEAAALTYSSILAFVPSLIVVFSILSIMTSYYNQISHLNDLIKDYFFSFLTLSTGEEILGILEKVMTYTDLQSLGVSGLIGFSVTFFFLLETIEMSFNHIWGIKSNRNFFVRIFRFSLFFILAAVLLSFLGGYLFQVLQIFQGFYPIGSKEGFLTGEFSKFLVYFITMAFAFKWIPNHPVRLKYSLLGAFITTFLFFMMVNLFSYYIYYAKNLRLVYAGMVTFPFFIFWIFLCWVVVLLGVVVSWRAQYGIWTESIYDRDPFRNKEMKRQRLKSFLPLLVLLTLYHHKKKSLLGAELQANLKVSLAWIRGALINLSEKGYLENPINELETNDRKFNRLMVRPFLLAEKIQMVKLVQDFLEPADSLLLEWENNLSPEVFLSFHRILAGSSKELSPKLTLQDILAQPKK